MAAQHNEPLAPCPGCGALFPAIEGPTHRYIGSSSGCWALYTSLIGGADPPVEILGESRVAAPAPHDDSPGRDEGTGALLVDAYAAQHHGAPSPQAMQSVAVHLLVLHGVFEEGQSPANALWLRRRAVRLRNVYSWLAPPAVGRALTLRHLFEGGGVGQPITRQAYVRSVHDAWHDLHGETLAGWFNRYVMPG